MKINTNIQLTPTEKEIFSVLRNVVREKAPNTTLRAAGGWVRDKLIGVPSDDIDIMVDNMSGEEFAYLVTDYLGSKDPHVIRENPDKSKHIETAKAYIPLSDGSTQEIDFARARKEVYGNSRVPDIQPATPQEDAMRRDLTINSMFYNLSTGQIEDFTGQGISDMLTDTIRTPLEPLKTFSDDPLRIFRVIRFTAKYNGNIVPEIYEAMKNPELIKEVNEKISKERIGQEFTKMLKNPNPLKAIELLKDTGLWQNIVTESLKGTKYEGKMEALDMEQNNPWHELTVWGHTMQVVKNLLERYEDADGETKITMTLAVLMHDMGKLFTEIQGESKSNPGRTSYHGHEKESKEIAEHILKYLRMDSFIKQVSGLARYHMQPHNLGREEGSVKAMRKFIRRMGEESLNWLDVFNMAAADAMSKSEVIDPEVVQKYQDFENKLQEAFLSLKPIEGENKVQPILNGNEVMQILNIKQGAWMSEIMEFVKEMKDENPDITKEDATALLLRKYPANPPDQPASKPSGMSQALNVEAKSSGEENENSKCSQHLFSNKLNKINESLKNDNDYEAFSIIRDLRSEFPNDEKVVRLIAKTIFELLLRDNNFRNIEILQHIFTKAEDNFFDAVLCSYVFGILVMIETETEKEIIEQIGERISKMSPGLLRTILKKLPTNSNEIFHPDIKEKFEKVICK